MVAPPGNYKHSGPTNIAMLAAGVGLKIIGAGRGVTIFTQADPTQDNFVVGETSEEHADQMVLQDFTLTGGKYALRVNNALLNTFERLALQNAVVGAYFEGTNESHVMRHCQILGHSQNGILTGQLNGGSGSVLDLPELQKCLFEHNRVAGCSGGAAVKITAGSLNGQQSSLDNLFRHMLLESNTETQFSLDHSSFTTLEHVNIEATALAGPANTYNGIEVLNCGDVTISKSWIPGQDDSGKKFQYGIYQLVGALTLRDVITGVGGAAGTHDIYVNNDCYIENCSVTDLAHFHMQNPSRSQIYRLLDSSGATIITVFTPTMPTADPHFVGRQWANNGIVTVSAG